MKQIADFGEIINARSGLSVVSPAAILAEYCAYIWPPNINWIGFNRPAILIRGETEQPVHLTGVRLEPNPNYPASTKRKGDIWATVQTSEGFQQVSLFALDRETILAISVHLHQQADVVYQGERLEKKSQHTVC